VSTKTIQYEVKSTLARTEYRRTRKADLSTVLDSLEDWMVKMDNFSKSGIRELTEIHDQFWTSKMPELPRGREGLNSPRSMVMGILENMRYGDGQFDLSKPQCDGIEKISASINVCFGDETPKLKFEKVTKL
jgi:hypothetical protein